MSVARECAAFFDTFEVLELSTRTELRSMISKVESSRKGWVIVMPRGARLNSSALTKLRSFLAQRPDCETFYADHALSSHGVRTPQLKPDWNPDLLLARDYVRFPVIVRRDAFLRILREYCPPPHSFFYTLLLAVMVSGGRATRVPLILIDVDARHAQDWDRPDLRRDELKRFMSAYMPHLAVRQGRNAQTTSVARIFDDHPCVTIVVPTCRAVPPQPTESLTPFIFGLLRSLEITDWPRDRLRVLVGDDTGDLSVYRDSGFTFSLTSIDTSRPHGHPFNYSRKLNRLLEAVETEFVVLMNDDILIHEPGWLKALMTFAMEAGVGGVGAHLSFPDGTIQHSGIIVDSSGKPCHPWFGRAPSRGLAQGDWGDAHRAWSMVTGAVFATRRSVLSLVGGFDERLPVEFNDLDLCLRMVVMGHRIVCTPHAQLTHYERGSRGMTGVDNAEQKMFLQRWGEFLASDPQSHPHLRVVDGVPTPDMASLRGADFWRPRALAVVARTVSRLSTNNSRQRDDSMLTRESD